MRISSEKEAPLFRILELEETGTSYRRPLFFAKTQDIAGEHPVPTTLERTARRRKEEKTMFVNAELATPL